MAGEQVRRHVTSVREAFGARLADVVYLSPDAPDPLPEVLPGKVILSYPLPLSLSPFIPSLPPRYLPPTGCLRCAQRH